MRADAQFAQAGWFWYNSGEIFRYMELRSTVRFFAFIVLLQWAAVASAQVPVEAWVRRYGASTNGPSRGTALGIDTHGNVFVSGSSWNGSNYGFATLAYSNTGVPLWTNRYDAGGVDEEPSALAVGANGNVFVTGSTYPPDTLPWAPVPYQFVTLAYSGSGAALWTNIFSEATNAQAAAIAVDQGGNVFVAGTSSSTMTTLGYSSAGVPLWTNHYQAVAGQRSSAQSIALDNQGNVFVAGSAAGLDGNSHYSVVAYSGVGVPLWTNQYLGPVNFGDVASAVTVDGSGNVLVTGSAYNASGYLDYLTIAYSGAGAPLWTNRYSTPHYSTANAIAADPITGVTFVTGESFPDTNEYQDFATVAYNAQGVPLWTNRYDGPAQLEDKAVAAAVDGRGHVVVTGYSETGYSPADGFEYDYATVWYSTSGLPWWTNRYNGPANGNDQAAALAVDQSGNVFVTGTSWNGTNYDVATIKYYVPPLPVLLVQKLGDRIVLSWTNAAFGLQVAPTLPGSFANVPAATSPYTNPIVGGGQFFRLISR